MIDEFTDALVAISRHFGVLERDTVCCGDVTVPQCVALQRLYTASMGVSTLSDYLGKSTSATTRLVDGLESRGWIDRRPNPDDGRRVDLVLTDDGRQRAAELRASTEVMVGEMLEHIAEDRRDDVIEALHILETAISQCRGQCCGAFDTQ